MATYTYKHAVKVNGKIIEPGTPVEVDNETKQPKTAEKSKKGSK